MPDARRHHGFSLLEVLISLLILCCGLLPLSAMVAASLQQLRASDADSRLLLAAISLAEARQLEAGRNGASGPQTSAARAALQHTVQTWWPAIAPDSVLLCRHAGALPAVLASPDCVAPGQLWLQLVASPSHTWQLPLE